MKAVLIFFLRFLAVQALLTAGGLALKKKKPGKKARVLLTVAEALIAIICAVLMLAGPVFLRPVQPALTVIYAALLTDAAAGLIYGIYTSAKKKERSYAVKRVLSLVLSLAFFAFGVWNMETVVPNRTVFTSPKLKEKHTLAFIADLHVGSAQPFSVTQKTIEAVKAEKPDALILGGDITDDYTTADQMRDAFSLFSDFGAPVYYVYGNHDLQPHADYANGRQFTEEELRETLERFGITLLVDEFAELAPDLTLLGRQDLSVERADSESLKAPDADAYLVVADHQPNGFKEAAAAGADLQLSGHTHAGQLFPLRAFYSLIGYCCGVYREGDSSLLVSSGACGWRFPMRTESRCHYEVVELLPE